MILLLSIFIVTGYLKSAQVAIDWLPLYSMLIADFEVDLYYDFDEWITA